MFLTVGADFGHASAAERVARGVEAAAVVVGGAACNKIRQWLLVNDVTSIFRVYQLNTPFLMLPQRQRQ